MDSNLHPKSKTPNPALEAKLRHMALRLAPLVQIDSGRIHEAFPSTLLQYHLLVETELNALAEFYHQTGASKYKQHYPLPITWSSDLTLEEKRRKWGQFMGLRGCETPVVVKTEEMVWEEARRERVAAKRECRRKEDEEMQRKRRWYS